MLDEKSQVAIDSFSVFFSLSDYLRSYGMYIGKIREISQTVRIIGPVRIIGT